MFSDELSQGTIEALNSFFIQVFYFPPNLIYNIWFPWKLWDLHYDLNKCYTVLKNVWLRNMSSWSPMHLQVARTYGTNVSIFLQTFLSAAQLMSLHSHAHQGPTGGEPPPSLSAALRSVPYVTLQHRRGRDDPARLELSPHATGATHCLIKTGILT